MKRKMKYFISFLLSLALVMQWGGELVLTSAAVTDNVSVAKVETLIGSPITETEPQSLFAYLREILSTVVVMSGQLDTLGDQMTTVSANVGNLKATAGGGCYYTVYTSKPYLNGYKLKLSDGISAKSCYIGYDDDSNYWCGVVRVPLANNITIEIIDSDTSISQGKMSTSAVTTSGYATLNLDTLIDNNINSILNLNDSLFTHLAKDSHFTANASLFPTILNIVYYNNSGLRDLLQSRSILINVDTFTDLYTSVSDLFTVITSAVGPTFLANASISGDIAENKDILKSMLHNNTVISVVENSSTFCEKLKQSAFTTQSVQTAGEFQQVTCNMILISITSGSFGDSYYYGTRRATGNHGTAIMTDCIGYISCRPSCTYVKDDVSITCISAGSTTGYSATYNYGSTHYGVGYDGSTTAACSTVYPIKFCSQATVNNMSPITVTDCAGYWDGNDTRTASTPSANSVITYIDLDA